MLSYAQRAEDVRLARALPGSQGTYLDIGACHPTIDSVTRYFYELGWRGINVEPQLGLWQRLCEERPEDLNVQAAVSDREAMLDLAVVDGARQRSTLDPAALAELRRVGARWNFESVPAIPLAQLIDRYVGERALDFLKIDVEGHEAAVIRGHDWQSCRPRVLVIEAVRPGTHQDSSQQWEGRLIAAEYQLAFFDGINRFYVRGEDAELAHEIARPINPTDEIVFFRQLSQWRWVRDRLKELHGQDNPRRQLARLIRFLGTMEDQVDFLLSDPLAWSEGLDKIDALPDRTTRQATASPQESEPEPQAAVSNA